MSNLLEAYLELFRNKRLLVLVGAVSGGFAILLFFSDTFLKYFSNIIYLDLSRTSVPIALLLVSVVSFSFIYLQSGAKEAPERYDSSILEKILKDLEAQKYRTNLQVDELRKKLETYELEKGLSEADKQAVIDGAVELTSEEAIKTFLRMRQMP